MPLDMYKKFGDVSSLMPTKSTLFSYCGHSIKPLGTVSLLCEAPKKFEFITFQVVDDKGIQGKPALLGFLTLLNWDLSSMIKQEYAWEVIRDPQ